MIVRIIEGVAQLTLDDTGRIHVSMNRAHFEPMYSFTILTRVLSIISWIYLRTNHSNY